jgi:hypothetical protein
MARKLKTKKQSKSKWRIYGWLVVLAFIAVFVAFLSTFGPGSKQHSVRKSYIYSYSGMNTPSKPIAGKPATFKVTIRENNKPFANRKVVAGISHTFGPPINSRDEDTFQKEMITDATGSVEFTYSFKFRSLLSDKGFGFYAYPVFNESEQAELLSKMKSDGVNLSSTAVSAFELTVYPSWLGWFVWR